MATYPTLSCRPLTPASELRSGKFSRASSLIRQVCRRLRCVLCHHVIPYSLRFMTRLGRRDMCRSSSKECDCHLLLSDLASRLLSKFTSKCSLARQKLRVRRMHSAA